jgi:uncharacterized protein (DUF58 family)
MTSKRGAPGLPPGGERLLDRALLARVGHLPLLARRAMVGSVSGRHRSPHRGSSVEFAEYRDYVPGDDLRRLDWRAYGRSDRFYVKEFEADTNLRLILVVDASGSMKYAGGHGTGTTTKLEVASRLAVTLAQMALRQGDAAGLRIASTEAPVDVPARRKPSHLRVMIEALANTKPAGETRLVETLHEAADRVQRRALFCIFSDLFTEPSGLAEAFQHLSFRHHDVAVFHLLDRDELEFDFEKPTRFVDPETGVSLLADPSMVATRYLAALKRYREALDEIVTIADLDYRPIVLGEDPGDVLSDFLLGRAGKGARA